MPTDFEKAYDRLLQALSALGAIRAIGKTGGAEVCEDGTSDIDVMVFCTDVPPVDERERTVLSVGSAVTRTNMNVGDDPYWGTVDFVFLHGTEICLMYHTLRNINAYTGDILRGERMERENGFFYPTGRIASLLSLHIYSDKDGTLAAMRRELGVMPESLARKMAKHHMDALRSTEDFRRAVERSDAFFYHMALENALDHFLQALFAMNRTWFPSRKRTQQFLSCFAVGPKDCVNRLLHMIELGGKPETVGDSYAIWMSLLDELRALQREPG